MVDEGACRNSESMPLHISKKAASPSKNGFLSSSLSWDKFALSIPTVKQTNSTDAVETTQSVVDSGFLLHLSNMRLRPTLDVDVVSHCNLT